MKKVLTTALTLLALFPTSEAYAAIPAVYTNDNFWTSEHDQPLNFSQDTSGNFFGVTKTGKLFYQININNEFDIRLQKFSIDEAYFYVSDRGIIRAENDLTALSIYLSKTT